METEMIIDLLTLIVAATTFCAAMGYFLFEEYHRRRDTTPICKIVERYHDNNVAVVIANRGKGVLIIDAIEIKKNGETRGNLITYMPVLEQGWKGYSLEIVGRDLMSKDEVVLCAIKPETESNRVAVLEALAGIEISVTYHTGHSGKKRNESKRLEYPYHFLKNNDYRIKGE